VPLQAYVYISTMSIRRIALLGSLLLVARRPIATANPEAPGESYGTSVAAADGAGVALYLGAIATRESDATAGTLLVGAGLTWALGGPAIHALHGNRTAALESLALRVTLPLGLAGALYLTTSERDADGSFVPSFRRYRAATGGFLLGSAIAWGVDWFVLATRPAPSRSAPSRSSRARYIPQVQVDDDAVALGVAGQW
jgi:hypothetical protein